MFKKLPFLVATFVAFAGFGQTMVSTSPENRNVVLEEFTGINCVFCPDGHAIAAAIQNANPDRVSLINVHTGSFASPGNNQPDFRTPYGAAFANQSGLNGYPAGTVNRHVFAGRGQTGGSTAMGRNFWTASANDILNMPSYVNVAVKADIDVESNTMQIHVEAYYTGSSPESTNLLNVAILQNNTRGPQTGGNQGNNYNHMHRLIDMVTGQWGEEITQTTAGTFVDRTFTYPLMNHNHSIPVEIGELEVVAFVTETHQGAISGSRATPSLNGISHSNDARVRYIEDIEDACVGEEITFTPKVNIQNIGTEDITALDIEYVVNGTVNTHSWTGSIASLKSQTIALPNTTVTIGESNLFEVTISDDDNNANNTYETSFGAVGTTGYLDLSIHAGQNSNQLRWRIRTSEGTVLHRGGPFEAGEVFEARYELEEGCYQFVLIDSNGNNDGQISLVDHHGTEVYSVNGSFGGNVVTQFSSNGYLSTGDFNIEAISLYPNPAQDLINITNAKDANIQIFDVLGKAVLSKVAISNNEGIQVSNLQSGVYFIKIAKEGKMTTKKFIISR